MTRALAPVDVVVVGSGLAAAAVALELARRDLTVELLAGARAGTPAGPGAPVAAQATVEAAAEPSLDLALLSRHLFADWLSALEEETGLPGEYDERGALTLASDEPEEVVLDRALDRQRAAGLLLEVLDPEEARGREPALTASLHAAFAFTRDGVARAGRVGRALVLSARNAGVRVREGLGVRAVAESGGRVSGVETPAGILPADAVVLAGRSGPVGLAGAAGLGLAGATRAWLRLDASGDPDRPARLLVARGASFVPRRDGTVLALGRPEEGEPGALPGAGRIADLLGEAARLVPASRAWRLVGTGSSRGASAPGRVPLLGETATGGLFLATGWGFDELLLAPAAAAVTADLLAGRTPPLGAGPFSPRRFGS